MKLIPATQKPVDVQAKEQLGGMTTMNDREKRDFEAGLNAEIDTWLRGDNTRRSFIKKFGLMTGLLATAGSGLSPWA